MRQLYHQHILLIQTKQNQVCEDVPKIKKYQIEGITREKAHPSPSNWVHNETVQILNLT